MNLFEGQQYAEILITLCGTPLGEYSEGNLGRVA